MIGWGFTLCGIVGALLVALNMGAGLIGYFLFLANASFMLGKNWGDKKDRALWVVFLVVNVIGIFRNF